VNVNEYTYSLAEGATGSFFDFYLTLANPSAADAPFIIELLPEGGGAVSSNPVVYANSVLQAQLDESPPDKAFSTVIHSKDGLPLIVERTMTWDDTRGYGGHGGSAVAPNTPGCSPKGRKATSTPTSCSRTTATPRPTSR
jgi:hypothetical protein